MDIIPREFVNGFCAPVIGIVGTYPVHKVVFIQQLYGEERLKAIDTVWNQGWRSLFRGVLPPILGKAASCALLFGFQEACSRELTPNFSYVTSHTLGAFFAGTM